jgi:Fanconi anemia group M protein
MTKIIIDNRERNFELIEFLEAYGVELEFSQLPVGDFILSKRVCVERKTIEDFENSVMNNRLFEQVERLSKSFERPFLLIEEKENYEHKLKPNSIIGAIIKCYLDFKVQVIFSKSSEESAYILKTIAQKEQEEKENEPRIVGAKKAYSEEEWQLLVLESLPEVGPKIARNLLKKFKSIRRIANASVEELMQVEKIGKEKAKRIYEIINREWKSSE